MLMSVLTAECCCCAYLGGGMGMRWWWDFFGGFGDEMVIGKMGDVLEMFMSETDK